VHAGGILRLEEPIHRVPTISYRRVVSRLLTASHSFVVCSLASAGQAEKNGRVARSGTISLGKQDSDQRALPNR